MIYISDSIVASRRYDLEPNGTEILWIEIPHAIENLFYAVHTAHQILVVLFGKNVHGRLKELMISLLTS